MERCLAVREQIEQCAFRSGRVRDCCGEIARLQAAELHEKAQRWQDRITRLDPVDARLHAARVQIGQRIGIEDRRSRQGYARGLWRGSRGIGIDWTWRSRRIVLSTGAWPRPNGDGSLVSQRGTAANDGGRCPVSIQSVNQSGLHTCDLL
jgi:hypothetical protein